MNDTVLSPRQIELLNEILSYGMLVVYCDPNNSEEEIFELCNRIQFNIENWKEENGMIGK